jgi:dihydrofolate synthase/folylpolyglutamate synthase
MNTYQEVVKWMFSRLPMYQQQGKSAFKGKLDNIIAFSKHLGNPQQQFKSIHIAGTNGKGSTSHMIASVLQEAGYKTGLYTSPHLKDFRERIRINGKKISKKEVVDFITNHKPFLDTHELSFFEMTVAMALDYFCKKRS